MTQAIIAWIICTSPVLAILISILANGYSATFDFTKCEITDNFHSDFVAATFKTLDAGFGCETNLTSSTGQEVHVIVVNRQVSDKEKQITIKLSIHSRLHANLEETEGVNFREEPQPVIFVLHSPQPVMWVIEMQGLNSQQKHLFMVSQESSVRFQKKKARLMAKVRKRVLLFSADNSTIFMWAYKRFGAVTSYSTISEIRVKFYIGRDVNANMTCDLNFLSLSLRVFSYREAVKPITGCVSKRRNHHVRVKPVYIIELLELPGPSPGVVGVDLEILPYDSGASLRSQGSDSEENWQFYLVVKSPPSLKWSLHSRKISGWVDIVADASADVKVTGVKISTVALRADDIQVTGKQLVEWSQDYIAPVQMYAGIHAANTIKLKVPLLETNIASTRDRQTDANLNGHEPNMPLEGEWDGDHKIEKVDHHDPPENLIHITCSDRVMEVEISKQILQMTGLDKSKVTFRDPSCGLTAETDDHIILCTELMHCGTHSRYSEDMISYTNDVVFQTFFSLSGSPLPNDQGSGLFEGDTSSGSPELNPGMDDEDFRSGPFTIPVVCTLPAVNQSINESKSTSAASDQQCRKQHLKSLPKCTLSLFKSSSFEQSVIEFPASIDPQKPLYIQAAIDRDITLQINSCWFSTSKVPDDPHARKKMIISHGCDVDVSFSLLHEPMETPDGANLPHTRLEVIITNLFNGHSPIYVHCLVHTCQRGDSIQTQECSIDGRVPCYKMDPKDVGSIPRGSLLGTDCGPLTIGPLDLVTWPADVKLSSATGSSGTTPNNSLEVLKHSNEQKVIIEGLDSPTVVGIAFAAFIIGILLIGTLWFIHTRTGPINRAVVSSSESEPASNVNPSSSTTMTA